ncbi:MAG: glycosyltransferase family 4 protein, partial [Poseidonia sp.]
MNSALRDRQALKRLRKMEQSASLRLGEHITKAVLRPWRLPFLPLSFPLLGLRLGLEHIGVLSRPETRVEWTRESQGTGLLVFVDGYSSSYVNIVQQDLVDVNKLRSDLEITVVCTAKYQSIFAKTDFPVFVLPDKVNLSGERVDDWGVLLEEQIGGVASFFQPAMVLVVGPYPHRSLKNLVRANPTLQLIHDQRPAKNSKKKLSPQLFTHLTGVLRLRADQTSLPETVEVHRVDDLGMTSWLSRTIASLETEKSTTLSFNEDASKRLIEVVHEAKRDTEIITKEIDRLIQANGIEPVHSLLMFTLINLELTDETQNKKATRDLFVGAIRSLGRTHFEHMLELADWRLDRYQDERAAKTVIQFLRNAGHVEDAAVYLKYVRDGEWKTQEIQNVTSRMLAQYGLSGPSKKEFTEMEPYEIEAVVRADLKDGDCATLKFELSRSKGGIKRKVKVLMNILKSTTDIHNQHLHQLFVDHGLFEHESMYLAKRLNRAFLQYGDAASALLALNKGPTEELAQELKKTQSILSKVNGSWLPSIGPISSPTSIVPANASEILYLAHMALPFESAGYCTRTHGLLTNLQRRNPNISVQTRLGYPLDKTKLDHLDFDDVQEQYEIDGLTYRYHKASDEGIGDEDEVAYIERAAMALIESARKTRPALIQAASNHVNGAIGLTAARALGLPFIYEVRGLWHMSRVARQPHFLYHAEYEAMDRAEIAVCLEADIVLAITHAVRYYLIEQGVDPHRILVLPNGVDSQRFVETVRDKELESELGLVNNVVIGYVGSFVQYEGLDLLIQAFAKLVDVESNVKLLLVGDGSIRQDLEDLVDELRIREHVQFTGRVPHDEVVRYHSLIDIAPFPRTPDIVCEFISPLKPFESMAMGQVVVASDVAALKEIVADGEHGRLFKKGNSQSLFEVLSSLVQDEEQRKRLKKAGRAWVVKERDWSALSAYLYDIHQHLLAGASLPELRGSGQALSIVNGKVSTVIQGKPTLMVIMDEFSTTALASDATLIRPTPENWLSLLNEHSVDMLVVESAWEGNDKTWHRKVGWYSEDDIADLKNLVEACRSRNIPTVFYNKEDPV